MQSMVQYITQKALIYHYSLEATEVFDSIEQLEIIKVLSNVWSCTLITFSNHMNELCKRYDVDFDTSMSTLKSTRLQSYTEGGSNRR